MIYRTLGRTGLKVSLLSYGSGGPSRLGQMTGKSFADQRALIFRCLDLGVNLFDTAPVYSESESILGRILSEVPRENYIIATKWKPNTNEGGYKEISDLEESLHRSLERLRVDCIDIFQMHAVLAPHYAEDVKRYYPALLRFQSQGKIRFIGLTEDIFPDPAHETSLLALQSDTQLWDTMMIKYGILNQYAAKQSLPLCEKYNVGVLNMSTVREKLSNPQQLRATIANWKQRGLIAAGSIEDDDPLGWLISPEVESIVAAGYKFGADHPAISTVITGASSIEHLEENARAIEGNPLPLEAKQRLVNLFGNLAEPD